MGLFTTITIKEKEYKCRLSARACVELENKLGTNPLNILIKASQENLPKLGDMLVMFKYSLQDFNHGISMDDVYGIYDDYCSEGGNLITLFELIIKIFKEAGLLPEEDEESKN